LVITYAGELDALLAAVAGRPGGSVGIWLDAAITAFIILLAVGGSALLRQRIALGGQSSAVAIAAMPLGLVAPAVTLALAAAAGVVTLSDGKIAGFGIFLGGTLLIVAKALGEELLFRGLLQPLLCRAWGVAIGITLASLAFTVIHVVGGWRDPVSLLNITLAGGWFGLLAWRTGGILAPTLAHASYNWAEEMLFGASPNPGTGAFGALFDVDLVGPARLGGSIEGLNASLLLTAVLVAIMLPLILRQPFAAARAKQDKTGQD
jgi:membrane protease YdiL (CAAX protease family)